MQRILLLILGSMTQGALTASHALYGLGEEDRGILALYLSVRYQ